MRFKIILLCFFILIFLYVENNYIDYTRITVASDKLPKNFNNYKIIHISDLHSKVFKNNNENLIKHIKEEKPDAIVITGDLIDRRKYDESKALKLIDGIKEICPIYYTTGNHEECSGKFSSLKEKLNKKVTILENKNLTINKEDDHIKILGLVDPTRELEDKENNIIIPNTFLKTALKNVEKEDFKILLSHRPELFDLYVEENIDLIFSGHAHGGQIRFPLIGGLIAPHQGFLPKYTNGAYKSKDSTMIVSRGLGNSSFPFRIFNRPHIIIVTLEKS